MKKLLLFFFFFLFIFGCDLSKITENTNGDEPLGPQNDKSIYVWPNVEVNMEGDLVAVVQYLLKDKLGDDFVSYQFKKYDSITQTAVKKFQKENNLLENGIVDSNTWEKLLPYLKKGDKGFGVMALQYILKYVYKYDLGSYGENHDGVDGDFGDATLNALNKFREVHNIDNSDTIGLFTWNALIKYSYENEQYASENHYGIWLYTLVDTGKTHEEIARKMVSLGIKRIYIKVADGYLWDKYKDQNGKDTVKIYHDHGLEVWAYAFNYPPGYNGHSSADAQAKNLYTAAQNGFDGFVADVEEGWDISNADSYAEKLLSKFKYYKEKAISDGVATPSFQLWATSWGNPSKHSLNQKVIDQYVDAHMPENYFEFWGYPDNGKSIDDFVLECFNEYKAQGVTKPVYQVVTIERHLLNAQDLSKFLKLAGPYASVFRIPSKSWPASSWNLLENTAWENSKFYKALAFSY